MVLHVKCSDCSALFSTRNTSVGSAICPNCLWARLRDVSESTLLDLPVSLLTYDSVAGCYRVPRVLSTVRIEGEVGIRVILGNGLICPDLFIERRPTGWGIVLHPDDGDPIGVIHFHDEGRIEFQPERCGTRALEFG